MSFVEELGKALVRANKLGLRSYATKSRAGNPGDNGEHRRDTPTNRKSLRVAPIGELQACYRRVR